MKAANFLSNKKHFDEWQIFKKIYKIFANTQECNKTPWNIFKIKKIYRVTSVILKQIARIMKKISGLLLNIKNIEKFIKIFIHFKKHFWRSQNISKITLEIKHFFYLIFSNFQNIFVIFLFIIRKQTQDLCINIFKNLEMLRQKFYLRNSKYRKMQQCPNSSISIIVS